MAGAGGHVAVGQTVEPEDDLDVRELVEAEQRVGAEPVVEHDRRELPAPAVVSTVVAAVGHVPDRGDALFHLVPLRVWRAVHPSGR